MTDYAIEAENACKQFKDNLALKHVDLKVSAGTICGLIGRNGSGKTVLMKCICGFLIPDSGEITVNYKRIGKDMDFPKDTGIIIETPGFLPNLTGMRNLELLASLRKKIDKKAVAEAIRAVGLDPEMKKPVSKYSLGMRQRLGIAQAIMEDPDLLILDDLGTEYISQLTISVLYELINTRMLCHRPTIYTSNIVDSSIFEARYTEKVASRILGSCQIFKFFGTDQRLKRGGKR